MNALEDFRVPAPPRFRLSEYDPNDSRGCTESDVTGPLGRNIDRIAELQNALYAEKKQSLLIVLQSMDTGGKDPIIRDVLRAVNPQACRVTAFKQPTDFERAHDHFWRFHSCVPAKGEIGVFNRSYYDEIIAGTAHDELPVDRRETLLDLTNQFERSLAADGIVIRKLYLHMSREEQGRRLKERMDDRTRHWELSESDFKERKYWDGYMRGFEQVLRATNTDIAPWYLIPSDHKWFRDFAASEIIVRTLERMNPQYPPAKFDLSTVELD